MGELTMSSKLHPRVRSRRKPVSLVDARTSYSMLLKSRRKDREESSVAAEPLVSTVYNAQNGRVSANLESASRVSELSASASSQPPESAIYQRRSPTATSHFQCRWRIYPRHMAMFVFCFILLPFLRVNACHPSLETPGWTSPAGDITIEFGKPLRILCVLNETFVSSRFPGRNASDLIFIRNSKRVEDEYVRIYNETAIEFYMQKPPASEDMYYCKLKHMDHDKDALEAVCLNKVVIGYKPTEPSSFECVTENWQSLHCEWTPKPNYVTTRYNVSFFLAGIVGRRPHYCPPTHQHMLTQNKCVWNTSTIPFYRQPYANYTMVLTATNVLGEASFVYHYDNFANMRPASPTKLTVLNKTSESVYLFWSLPFPLDNFPPGLIHRINYQSQWDPMNSWTKVHLDVPPKASKVYHNLTDLKYANTVYDVRVSMKSASSKADKWGNYSVVTFRTSPKLPMYPPRTDIGSFEVVENNNSRDVYLYWQVIPAKDENGDEFRYSVEVVDASGQRVKLENKTDKTYAKFMGLNFNNYRFEIASVNIVGKTKQTAKIYVPSRDQQPVEPIAFTKIAFDKGLYELSWKPPPKSDTEIKNYTIFWCENDRDRPYQCTGYFDWIHVPKNITVYNMTVPDENKIYQFAISANTESASSGMVWASCTVIHNKVVGKMKSAWINRIGSNYIEVGWKLECSDRIGLVEGFNIYYCPIINPYDQNCQNNSMQNVTIKADPHTIHGIVYGLKPYTTYKISVSVLTKKGEGLHSDPLFNTTLEAAPSSPPKNVKVFDVTNTSVAISWTAPIPMNGILRYHEVYCNSKSFKVENGTEVVLHGLSAHTNYSITVKACTVSCSVKSDPVYVFTEIGVPGPIDIPSVRFINSSQVEVVWKAPEVAAGLLDYYQIMNSSFHIQNSTGTESQLSIPDCQTVGREMVYKFQIRAVNIAKNNTHLYGPWSIAGEGNCYGGVPSKNLQIGMWGICIVAIIAFIAVLAMVSKRLYIKCQDMRDVGIKLPPGLAPNMKLLQKGGEQHIRQSSTDSSGCSSGQESVTSSLTSESHVSGDSGADVDPSSNCNKLLEPSLAWETSSLRQRNVNSGKVSTVTDSRWDPYTKLAKSGEVPQLDSVSLTKSSTSLQDEPFASSPQTRSSTGYVTMASSEDGSSNSSPIPGEISNLGAYCILGAMPKQTRPKSDDFAYVQTATAPTRESVTPYVALAVANAKSTDRTKSTSFNSDTSSNRPAQQKTFEHLQNAPTITLKTDPTRKSFNSCYSSDGTAPYVSITGIPDIMTKSNLDNTKATSPGYQTLHSAPVPEKSDSVEDMQPLWQSAGSEDSVSSDSSGIEDETACTKKTNPIEYFGPGTGYPTKTVTNQADEQYSKVAAIKSTVP